MKRWLSIWVLFLPGCLNWGGVDLAPKYEPNAFVVPASWHGQGPFVEANPSDAVMRKDWWKVFGDPVLDKLEEQAMEANPELHASAERFVQARDEMMKARSGYMPKLGAGIEGQQAQQSNDRLFRSPASPLKDWGIVAGGLASWEPDFWSEVRNATRSQIFQAEEVAAQYANARLSIQAELATDYFLLRGLDAQSAIFQQSIEYYKQSVALVESQFKGLIASELDVARAKYQLSSTQARLLGIEGRRQVAEHAIAALVNMAPASFTLAPVETLPEAVAQLPASLPSTLLERRPDVAAMERRMAEANRTIGIARAAFFPHIGFHAGGGFEGPISSLFQLINGFWSYGSLIEIPIFQGGYRRAQLQESWSMYRETEDRYRATVLNAFREVEDGLSLTDRLAAEVIQQNDAIEQALRQQSMSAELYKGGLASSLELINAQVNTLESRITSVEIKTELLRSQVALTRALGGGWSRDELPKDDEIQPFGTMQYGELDKPEPAGGIDVRVDKREERDNLTQPVSDDGHGLSSDELVTTPSAKSHPVRTDKHGGLTGEKQEEHHDE